jgi:hypothetical protein
MRRLLSLSTSFALIALAAGFLTAVVGTAQAQSPSAPSTAPAQTPPSNISDEKLDRVAAAAKNVTVISKTYRQKLAAAPDGDKQRIVDEANGALTKAIADQGMSVDEYESIMLVAQNNPAVRDKILDRMMR